MSEIKVHDKAFRPILSAQEIAEQVSRIATEINHDYQDKQPVFIVVLNGAFIFAADLLRKIQLPHEVSFIKVNSYVGTASTGKVNELIGLSINIHQKDIILIEDIIETGNTLNFLIEMLRDQDPASLQVVTLLMKHQELHRNLPVAYTGFQIADGFVVGYGLDYDGFGRNLPNIYVAIPD